MKLRQYTAIVSRNCPAELRVWASSRNEAAAKALNLYYEGRGLHLPGKIRVTAKLTKPQ